MAPKKTIKPKRGRPVIGAHAKRLALTIRISQIERDALDQAAELHATTPAKIVRRALRNHLKLPKE